MNRSDISLNIKKLSIAAILASSTCLVEASPAKFNIPGDFPGDFRIDFLGTDFKLNGGPAGSLSTASTIDFHVGSGTGGIYDIAVNPTGFNFLGFQAAGLSFDVYGAGMGYGSFDTNTGHWDLYMPTLFMRNDDWSNYHDATRLDLHLTTQNIWVSDLYGSVGYMTTTASPMVLDEASPEPWGDLNLVAGGTVMNSSQLTLNYDWGLINSILSGYSNATIDRNTFAGVAYEFDIYGNDPLLNPVPVPAAVWLFGSGIIGLLSVARRKRTG